MHSVDRLSGSVSGFSFLGSDLEFLGGWLTRAVEKDLSPKSERFWMGSWAAALCGNSPPPFSASKAKNFTTEKKLGDPLGFPESQEGHLTLVGPFPAWLLFARIEGDQVQLSRAEPIH